MADAERELRDALALFPSAVAVVTAEMQDGTRLGTTVSSFTSVSLSPPLVLFCVARSAYSFASWSQTERYAVNLLAEHHGDLSTRFARPLGEKWNNVRSRTGASGQILLGDALVWFECEKYAHYDGGDHLICVGKIISFAVSPVQSKRPLIFFRSGYRKLDSDDAFETPVDLDHLLHGW